MKKPGPMKLAREFASGKWTNMLAEKYGMAERSVQLRLMDAVRKLLDKRKDGGK